jgi:hypothetical protein
MKLAQQVSFRTSYQKTGRFLYFFRWKEVGDVPCGKLTFLEQVTVCIIVSLSFWSEYRVSTKQDRQSTFIILTTLLHYSTYLQEIWKRSLITNCHIFIRSHHVQKDIKNNFAFNFIHAPLTKESMLILGIIYYYGLNMNCPPQAHIFSSW